MKERAAGKRDLTPPQTVGPFFHGLLREGLNVMAPSATDGVRIRIEGCVYDGNRAPVADAMIEIWQANAQGHYNHPADQRVASPDPTFAGFGRAGTDDNGQYWFETIRPGKVPIENGSEQAPHLNVAVSARGLLHHLFTRMYFDDEAAANARDAVLRGIPEARRGTMLAKKTSVDGKIVYRFDIVLQGQDETVFFDL